MPARALRAVRTRRAALLLALLIGSLAASAADQYEYSASSGVEPDQLPDSPWTSSGLGSASFSAGLPPVLCTRDDTAAGDGRFYFLPLRGWQVGPEVPLRLEVRVRVLSSAGSTAATCVQMCAAGRRFGLGFDTADAGPEDDRVLLLDFGVGGGGKVLGDLPLAADLMRDYVLEVRRTPGGARDTLSLRAGDAPPLEVPWSTLVPSSLSSYHGLVFGHPVGAGTGAAEWERIGLTCEGNAEPTGPRAVDGQRQLLVDDWLVQSVSNVSRRQGALEKYARNPTLVRDQPWEAARVELYGSAFYDSLVGRLRCYYSAMLRPYEMRQALAESTDLGETWSKPLLGIWPFEGRDTNVVYAGRYAPHGPSVFCDPRDPDPARRYKLFTAEFPVPIEPPFTCGEPGIDVAYSPDGIHWTPSVGNPVLPGYISDTGQCAFYDPRLDRYVAYVRMWTGERCVGRTESEDFEHWSPPELVYSPEPADRRQSWQFYGLSVTPYQGMYIGLVWIFPAVPASGDWSADTPATWPELVTSRDGFRWERVAPGEAFLPLGPQGAFDHRQIRPASSMVELPDRIILVYSGSPHPHVAAHSFDIGCASLRLDGFAARHAGPEGGELVTRPLTFAPGVLQVNARMGDDGYLAAEVLDASGEPWPGYGREDCLQITGDHLDAALSWTAHSTLPPPGPEGLRLRFILRNADLYSFRISGDI